MVAMELTWTFETEREEGPFHDLWAVEFDGRLVVAVESLRGGVDLYDPAEGPAAVGHLPGPTEAFSSMCPISTETGGQRLAAGRADGLLRVWDLATRAEVTTFMNNGEPYTMCPVPRQGRQLLAIGCIGGSVPLWDVEAGTVVEQIGDIEWGLGADVMCTLRSYGRDLLATSCGDLEYIQVWDIAKNAEWARMDGERTTATICAVPTTSDPSGDQLLAGSDFGGRLTTWDPTTGEAVARMGGDEASMPLFPVSAGSRHLLGVGRGEGDYRDGNNLHLLDPLTGETVYEHSVPGLQVAVQVGDHLFVQCHPGRFSSYRIES